MPELFLEQIGRNHPGSPNTESGITITKFPYTIGRMPDSDYTLPDPMISRSHCTFFCKGSEIWIQDLQSTNGTFVNARKVSGGRMVQDGDLIKLGILFFQAHLAAAAVEATKDAGTTLNVRRPKQTPHQVLVVDDNVDGAETLADLLKYWGHQVRVAYDGPTALRTAQEFHPDTILLDLKMPGMDGYQVAGQLRLQAGLEKAVVIAITGYDSQMDQRRSRQAGIDRLLVKPVDLADLEAVFNQTS